jgi:hypothetical protein
LYEEARLAAALGDRPGATRALQHYFALRSNSDPLWRKEVHRARALLDSLMAK